MFNTIVGTGAVGAGAASRYGSGSGSDQKMRLLAAPAPQHRLQVYWLYLDIHPNADLQNCSKSPSFCLKVQYISLQHALCPSSSCNFHYLELVRAERAPGDFLVSSPWLQYQYLHLIFYIVILNQDFFY
jgi:hypothetical protein